MVKKVYVGMSGGVDSSLTAALLQAQGYNVTGVYMKNWSQDLPGMLCPWREDYQDALAVAVTLGIELKLFDFEKQYRHLVVDYMLQEYQTGRTPNPDIMCNQEVKFKLFLQTALTDGADLIATGHYARVVANQQSAASSHQLWTAKDKTKDQSYFLYRVTEEALSRSLMPIGEFMSKAEVRAEAKRRGLPTAAKKDSQGICFVGKVGIRDFLLHELGPQAPGPIVDQNGKVIGEHDGAIFYTIGQRHGLDVGGGLPYYVTGKDMKKNEVHVTTNLDDARLWYRELRLRDTHWINGEPEEVDYEKWTMKNGEDKLQIRTRYRAPLIGIESLIFDGDMVHIKLKDEVRAITPGQSAVIYDGDSVLGGGILT